MPFSNRDSTVWPSRGLRDLHDMEVDSRRTQARMDAQSRMLRGQGFSGPGLRHAGVGSSQRRPIGFFGHMLRLAVFGLIVAMFGPRIVNWLAHVDQAQINRSFVQFQSDLGRILQQADRSDAGRRLSATVSNGLSDGMSTLSRRAQRATPPNLSMSDPRNPNGWTNMNSPNNSNGWTNMNSPNNPVRFGH